MNDTDSTSTPYRTLSNPPKPKTYLCWDKPGFRFILSLIVGLHALITTMFFYGDGSDGELKQSVIPIFIRYQSIFFLILIGVCISQLTFLEKRHIEESTVWDDMRDFRRNASPYILCFEAGILLIAFIVSGLHGLRIIAPIFGASAMLLFFVNLIPSRDR